MTSAVIIDSMTAAATTHAELDTDPHTIPPVKSVALILRAGFKCLRGVPDAAEDPAELLKAKVANDAAELLQREFRRAGVKVVTADEDECSSLWPSGYDLVIALGGDGTFLRALRCFAGEAPIVGINCGTLGFLSIGGPEVIPALVADAVAGRLVCEARLRLDVEIWKQGVPLKTRVFAYNDAVVKVGSNPRLLELACSVNDRRLATYKADGVILATPLGSTAYNLAAGGPILCPDSEVYSVTALNPHSLTHRPVVVGGRSKTRVTMAGPPNNVAYLTVDGQPIEELKIGDSIVVTEAETPYMIVAPGGSVFDVLASKLGWDSGRS